MGSPWDRSSEGPSGDTSMVSTAPPSWEKQLLTSCRHCDLVELLPIKPLQLWSGTGCCGRGGTVGSIQSGVSGPSLALDVEHPETGSHLSPCSRSCCSVSDVLGAPSCWACLSGSNRLPVCNYTSLPSVTCLCSTRAPQTQLISGEQSCCCRPAVPGLTRGKASLFLPSRALSWAACFRLMPLCCLLLTLIAYENSIFSVSLLQGHVFSGTGGVFVLLVLFTQIPLCFCYFC